MNVNSNWWQSFFEGVSVSMWLQAVPREYSLKEAEEVERLLGAAPGSEILDVPCGGGRLSVVLGERGYRVTGVDVSQEFLQHARSVEGGNGVTWEQRDMRDLPWEARFDGALCVGNSFGYLDDEGNMAFLRAVKRTLKPGARFVLQTPMVIENLLGHLQARPWWKAGDVYLLIENDYDAVRQRLDIEYTFVSNGRVEARRGSHRAYTYRELAELIAEAGFAVAPAEPWSRGAHNVTFIATA